MYAAADVPRPGQPLLVLFHKVPRGPVRMIKVSAASVALADACDGHQTVTGMVDQLTRRFGPGIEQQATGALGWLRENGVIGLRSSSVGSPAVCNSWAIEHVGR